MRTLPLLCLVLALATALPTAAQPNVDELQRALVCSQPQEDAQILIAWSRAWPGQVLPANLFHLGNEPVDVDVCLAPGGSVTLTHLDTLLLHAPMSSRDVFYGPLQCFSYSRDTGDSMTFGDRYTLAFRYDAAAGQLRVSPNGGASWHGCLPLAASQFTPAWAVVPWYSYTQQSSVRGKIVVLADA